MKPTPKLLLRVEPIFNESFTGFLARLAAKNYLRTTKVLYDLLDLDRIGFLGKMEQASENITYLAAVLSVTPERLSQMLPTFTGSDASDLMINGLELKENHFSRKQRRVSPSSLAISPHHRINWQLSDLPFCPESWELLINRCPVVDCGAFLLWKRTSGPHICEKCGFDLRNAVAEKIRVEDRQALRFVADLVSHDELENQRAVLQLHPSLRHLNRGVLLQLVNLFGRAEAGLRGYRDTRKRRQEITYPNLQIKGAEILKGYPQSVRDITKSDYRAVVPRFFMRLRAMTRCGSTEATVAFIRQMMAELRPGAQSTTEGLALIRKDNDLLTGREVGEMLRISKAFVGDLVRRGILKSDHVRGTKREHYWHRRDEVMALAAYMHDRIDVGVIHSRYRLSATAIEQLVDMDLLRWHPCEGVNYAYRGIFLAESEFEAFRQKLNAAICVRDPLSVDRLRLSELFAMLGPVSRPWGGIIDMTIRQALPGGLGMIEVERGYRASNLTVSRKLAAQVQQGQVPWMPVREPPRKYCTLIEAEERLACHPNDIRDLIASEQLKRIDSEKPRVCRESVLASATTFISSQEIAARLGITPTSVAGWANRRKLRHPVANIRFYLRVEVESWLPPILYTGWHTSEGSVEIASQQSSTDDVTDEAEQTAA